MSQEEVDLITMIIVNLDFFISHDWFQVKLFLPYPLTVELSFKITPNFTFYIRREGKRG